MSHYGNEHRQYHQPIQQGKSLNESIRKLGRKIVSYNKRSRRDYCCDFTHFRGVIPSVFLKKALKTVLELKPLS